MFNPKYERETDNYQSSNKNNDPGTRSNTSPLIKKSQINENIPSNENFKNSNILKNATSNIFFDENLKKNNPFANTFNYPENFKKENNNQNASNSRGSASANSLKINSNNGNFNSVNNFNLNSNLINNTNSNTNISTSNNISNLNNNENNSNNTLKVISNKNTPRLMNSTGGTYPSLITPQLMKNESTESNKQVINLEDLLTQEEKLWHILESLRFQTPLNFVCEEYLDFLNVSSIQNLDNYFSLKLKSQITLNNILEILSVMCVVISAIKQKLNENIISHLKNLLYNVHQNYLILMNLVMQRMPRELEKNVWVIKLNSIIAGKQVKNLENQDAFLLGENNKLILNILTKFNYTNFKNRVEFYIFDIINDILINHDKYTYLTVKSIVFNIRNSIFHMSMISQNVQNFPVIPAPYLPPLPTDKKNITYTLVLDLDETLVHYTNNQENGELLIRPGTENFIKEMSKFYEVVVFTAALQDYADWILDKLDPEKNHIKHRLYRYHASINKNTYVKDISKLGRDLSKTIIIDNVWENFQLQPENGIFIRTWIDDNKDTSLIDLMPLLRDIVIKKVPDIRKTLRKFRDTLIRLYVKGDPNPYETLRKYLNSDESL